jgi:hypothetical protein
MVLNRIILKDAVVVQFLEQVLFNACYSYVRNNVAKGEIALSEHNLALKISGKIQDLLSNQLNSEVLALESQQLLSLMRNSQQFIETEIPLCLRKSPPPVPILRLPSPHSPSYLFHVYYPIYVIFFY